VSTPVASGRTRPATLPALDSMRAVAAIAALATHAAYWGGAYGTAVWGTPLARLDLGVAIFFVLSGFLLSRAWFDRHARGLPPPSTRRYFWRRALRIVPVYVLAVVAAYLLLPGNDDASPGDWVVSLLLLDTYVHDSLPDGLTQMWSLGTEVAFYAVLPLVMWAALPRRGAPGSGSRFVVVVAVLVAVNVVWILAPASRWVGDDAMVQLWLPSYLTWFCTGMVLAACHVAAHGPPGTGPIRPVTRAVVAMGTAPGTCWTAALALFVVACTPVAGPYTLVPPSLAEALTKNLLYAVVAGLVILPGAFAPPEGRYVTALSHPALRHLGHLSYGLFCFHLVVLELVADWRDVELFRGRTWELFGLTLVLTLVVCELVYRLVERPALRLKDLGRTEPAPATDNQATVSTARS
jgi:peptidoglycan/LPS O-acetylase OafA/YrhL